MSPPTGEDPWGDRFSCRVQEWIDLNKHFSEDDSCALPNTEPVGGDLRSTSLQATDNDHDEYNTKNHAIARLNLP